MKNFAKSTKYLLGLLLFLWYPVTCNAQYHEDQDLVRFTGVLETYALTPNEVVFLLDESGSIGAENFPGVIKFTEMTARLLSLSEKDSRVAVVTFGTYCRTHIDYITEPEGNNMCTFLSELTKVDYAGGGTHTGDAMIAAQILFLKARENANKIIVLISDGRSNGGHDLNQISTALKLQGVIIFAVGIADVNENELIAVATSKSHIYIMKDLQYIFTLNQDIKRDTFESSWDLAPSKSLCNGFCSEGHDCCDVNADCFCGTHGGRHQCVCKAGFQGEGSRNHCLACPKGTYKDKTGGSNCDSCPGNSTTYSEGSTSLNACQCILGYKGRPQDKKACSIVRCSKLAAPSGGAILPFNCGNIYSSECNFRCNEGYCPYSCNDIGLQQNAGLYQWNTLSQARRCDGNGLWTGQDFLCEKMRCPSLSIPRNGQHNCTNSDFTFNTVCGITCKNGFSLIGSTLRTCLMTGSWTGEETVCKGDVCSPLKTNEKIEIKPKKCGNVSSEYQSICQYYCREGFRLVAYNSKSKVGERKCLLGGKWSNSGEKLSCKDAQLPTINCPPSITESTNPGKATALIIWNLPEVSDNVAVDTSEIIYPKHVKKPPQAFPLNVTKIVYQVRDTSGLINNCTFSITVIDKEPPRITYCPPDIEKLHNTSAGLKIFWKKPEFEDNSGFASIRHVNKKNGAMFFRGNPSKVIYNITDLSGNTAVCSFLVKVKGYSCPYMDPPTNGFLACDTWSDGQFCKVSCKKTYVFVEPPETVYFCSQRTKSWTKFLKKGKLHLPWPDCARTRKPRAVNSTFSAKYSVNACNDEDIEAVKADFIKTARAHGFCPPNPNLSCVIKKVNVTCKLPAESLKVKRSISDSDLSFGEFIKPKNLQILKIESFEDRVQHLSLLRQKREASEGVEMEISFTVEVYETKDALEENATAESCENCNSTDLNQLFEYGSNMSDGLKSEIDNIVDTKYKQHSPVRKGFVLENMVPICVVGSMLQNNTCVVCPVGTYFKTSSSICKVCPKDYYQDEEGNTTCKKCPIYKLTLHTKSKELADCKDPCPPGLYSYSGLEPCKACPRGSYAQKLGSTDCNSCPPSLMTSMHGATSATDCISACGRGTYSSDGFPPCVPCPKGTYQPKLQSLSCLNCPNGTTTIVENADAIAFCQSFQFCKDYKPCMNGSTCLDKENDYECICLQGFSGKHCDLNINDCDVDSCFNGGTCVDGVNSITCLCPTGFSGFRCEVNNDDCYSDICQYGGTCEDLVNDYICHCVEGFLGKNCEENIDECALNPCMNNGTCFDAINDFKCCCPKAFTGHSCDVQIDNCPGVTCFNGGTCHSTVEGYSCSCSIGFEGNLCDINIDDCASSPCKNGGTCVDGDNHITCFCPEAFYGDYCEKDLLLEFSLEFSSPMTSNYVRFDNPYRLFAITVSFFMRTNYVDEDNKGTPVSYAFHDPEHDALKDNAITLMDTSNLMLYLHGKLFHTGVAANKDFDWHHYVVTWDNADGSWSFYVDGGVIISDNDVAKGSYLYPGVFILGQEQDSLGSSFSISESFVGEITEFNVWDYSFSSEEIIVLGKSCGFLGNVVKWPVLQNHLFGEVIMEQVVELCKDIGTCSFQSCYCGLNNGSISAGHICKQKVDDCLANPCQNEQKCIVSDIASYCDCSSGYGGRRCEHDIDECLVNNGKCEQLCINTIGSYKCSCQEGQQLSSDNHTCIVETNTCTFGKYIYNNGDKWTAKCEECLCELGNVECHVKPCPNVTCELIETAILLPGQCCETCLSESACVIQDNNELKTFDGQIFDFFGYCEYNLVNNVVGEFSIQFQTSKELKDENLCKRSVTIRVLCSQLVIAVNGSLKLNENDISLPYKDDLYFVESDNTTKINVKSSLGVSVEWDCSGNVSVTVPRSYKRQLTGLCGNFNANFTDDLTVAKLPPDNIVSELNCSISWKRPMLDEKDDEMKFSASHQDASFTWLRANYMLYYVGLLLFTYVANLIL